MLKRQPSWLFTCWLLESLQSMFWNVHNKQHTSYHHVICVKTGNKVYHPKQWNNNFIPNLLKHNNAILINFNQLIVIFTITYVYLQVPLFLNICGPTLQYFYAKHGVTIGLVFMTRTFLITLFFMFNNCVYMNKHEMLEGSS